MNKFLTNLILNLLSRFNYPVPRNAVYSKLEKHFKDTNVPVKLYNVINFEPGVGLVQRGMQYKFDGKKYYIAKTNGVVEVVSSLGPQEFIRALEVNHHNQSWFPMLNTISADFSPETTHLRDAKGRVSSIVDIAGDLYLVMEFK